MGIDTAKYIRKPLYVQAVRVTSQNFDEIVTWCQGEVQQDEIPGETIGKQYVKVRVHNPKNARQTKAFVGDWLLYTERGYKVYTNKAFHASFDLVTNEVGHDAETGQFVVEQDLPKYPEPEFVPATPEGIAQAVRDNELNTEPTESAQAKQEMASSSEDATPKNGKTVLSEQDQQELGPEEVRKLLRQGNVVLAQDLA